MTNDEIRTLALSHGFTLRPQPDGLMDLNPYVYAFARALVEQEREACAKACEDSVSGFGEDTEWARGYVEGIKDVAEGIRNRKDTTE